jgi:hypothetical protein
VSFDRDGKVLGQPLITYASPAPDEDGETLREAVARALKLCEPLPLSDTFRDVVAVQPDRREAGQWIKKADQAIAMTSAARIGFTAAADGNAALGTLAAAF